MDLTAIPNSSTNWRRGYLQHIRNSKNSTKPSTSHFLAPFLDHHREMATVPAGVLGGSKWLRPSPGRCGLGLWRWRRRPGETRQGKAGACAFRPAVLPAECGIFYRRRSELIPRRGCIAFGNQREGPCLSRCSRCRAAFQFNVVSSRLNANAPRTLCNSDLLSL